jgi:hypothetical protein
MPYRRVAVVCLGAASILAAGAARAEDVATNQARARDAYDRGSIAYRRGDYARAAAEFAQADALAPDPVALRAALDAATLADDAVLGTELLERARRAPGDKTLADVVATARARFAHRTGRIVVRCPESASAAGAGPTAAAPCLATLDGTVLEPSKERVVAVGVHTVTVQSDGAAEQRIVQVGPDQSVEISPSVPREAAPAPPPSPAPAPSSSGGISPAWFAAAAGATAVLGGLTVWSGLDTSNRHSSFANTGCSAANPPAECGSLRSDGLSAEHRTNVLLAGTAALAVGTAALGLFFVRWNARLEVRGTEVSLRTSF